MKIRMLMTVRGAVDGHWSPNEGDEFEVSDPAGALLCARGFAEPVAQRPKAETATPRKRVEKRSK